jgi:hypothetical protein
MKIYLRGGPKDGESATVRANTDYWSFAADPEPLEPVDFFKPMPESTTARWRTGVYKDSGHRMKNQYGGVVPVFTWQGYQQ